MKLSMNSLQIIGGRGNRVLAASAALALFSTFPPLARGQDFQVLSAVLEADPANYDGPCPATIRFRGSITAKGKGTAKYLFERSDGAVSSILTLDFDGANGEQTHPVSTGWTLSPPAYSGWESIRVLSPNELASNQAWFKMICRDNSCKQTPPPKQAPARFRVTINGFSVLRATLDDFLERDGKGDEVFLLSRWRLTESGGMVHESPLLRSRVMGDGTGRSDRVIAGSAAPGFLNPGLVGGLLGDDTFPSLRPWVLSGAPTWDRVPMLLFDGEIRAGQTLVVVPTIFEWDGPDDLLTDIGRAFNVVLDLGARSVAPAPVIPGLLGQIMSRDSSGIGSEVRVSRGIFGDPKDRPIGMSLDSNSYTFTPWSLRFTYDLANEASRTDFGHGPGVIPVRYTDHNSLLGDYLLFVQIERF